MKFKRAAIPARPAADATAVPVKPPAASVSVEGFSPAAIRDLERSGISPADAFRLGMFSVENARDELSHAELRAEPALVLPYYDPDGQLMEFERDGAALPF